MATPNEIIEGILAKTLGTSVNKKTGKEKNKPVAEFELVYDSPSETLEPVYFWIVDMMNNLEIKLKNWLIIFLHLRAEAIFQS